MPAFCIPFSDPKTSALDLVGSKGSNLGALRRAGMPVPDGFCLTTSAFRRYLAASREIDAFYARLERVDVDDRKTIAELGEALRSHLQELPMPADVCMELFEAWHRSGEDYTYAVRSSATAEDLADASFAGQHDTVLNVKDETQLLDAVRQCWISLFSNRAIGYRARYGFDHSNVDLAVVVQRMILPEVSGVMFTADPISGHRKTIVVNAAYGLGEAVVSGLVNPDLYRIEENGRVEKSIADKKLMIAALPTGGVSQQDVPEDKRNVQALPDEQIAELAKLGRRIRDHFGAPQDIEWAWADGRLQVLQSRPITSLYPIPEPPEDGRLHIYFSFGHQQMMTDAIKPLGLSALRTYFPFGKRRPSKETTQMVLAGNRIYVDYTNPVHSWLARRTLIRAAGTMNKRMGEALLAFAHHPDFGKGHHFELSRELMMNWVIVRTLFGVLVDLCWVDMSTKEPRTTAFMERTLAQSRAAVEHGEGANRLERIQLDMRRVSIQAYYRITTAQFTAMAARLLLERQCGRQLGQAEDLSALDKALPGNVTTEMGLAIGDLADLVRDQPDLLKFLQSPPEPFTMSALDDVEGGDKFKAALEAFLERYGMRCPGEIDITRERWSDDPRLLFAGIIANLRTGAAGEHRVRFHAGEREADAFGATLRERLGTGWLGRLKGAVATRLVNVYRTSMGLREHQKFLYVGLWDIYRRAIGAEARTLVEAGVLASESDAGYLSLDELRRIVDGDVPDGLGDLVRAREAEHRRYEALTPPRMFTSDGELVASGSPSGVSKQDGVLAGVPVSSGVVEGRARVLHRPEEARLDEGDILVAPYTDPGWTPLFSAVRGIVLEIGGLMTHGAVVARELGLPTVVGVDDATRLIPDGARIRVDGSRGVVEVIRGGTDGSTDGGTES